MNFILRNLLLGLILVANSQTFASNTKEAQPALRGAAIFYQARSDINSWHKEDHTKCNNCRFKQVKLIYDAKCHVLKMFPGLSFSERQSPRRKSKKAPAVEFIEVMSPIVIKEVEKLKASDTKDLTSLKAALDKTVFSGRK